MEPHPGGPYSLPSLSRAARAGRPAPSSQPWNNRTRIHQRAESHLYCAVIWGEGSGWLMISESLGVLSTPSAQNTPHRRGRSRSPLPRLLGVVTPGSARLKAAFSAPGLTDLGLLLLEAAHTFQPGGRQCLLTWAGQPLWVPSRLGRRTRPANPPATPSLPLTLILLLFPSRKGPASPTRPAVPRPPEAPLLDL